MCTASVCARAYTSAVPRRGGPEPDAPRSPGWYPDPWSATGEGERYFDGKRWGSTQRPLGRSSTMPSEDRRGPRGRRRIHLRLPTIVAILFIVGAAVIVSRLQHRGGGSNTRAQASTPTSSVVDDRPPPSREEQPRPLGAPSPVPPGTGKFEVTLHQRDTPSVPVAFDPCRPVHYVLNPEGAPPDGASLIRDAIARVQTATGLQFVFDGTTTEAPNKERPSYQPERYGRRWAPVLVAWSDENAFPELAGYVAGIGSADPVYAAGNRLVYVSGEVVLDRQQLSPASTPDRAMVRAIMLHELGHVMGLAHTSDRAQIMFSETQFDVRDYGEGDLRGLALLGTQACFPGT